jgi:hypothetical protein
VSAQEIIEQIKALPANERAAVADFVRELERTPGATPTVSYIDPAAVEANMDKMFDRYDDLFRKLAK